ncbi:hypothetical protein FKM82_009901 [Ascaphus truei]
MPLFMKGKLGRPPHCWLKTAIGLYSLKSFTVGHCQHNTLLTHLCSVVSFWNPSWVSNIVKSWYIELVYGIFVSAVKVFAHSRQVISTTNIIHHF